MNIQFLSTDGIAGPGTITLDSQVLDTDPLFVKIESKDYQLQPDSPCLDFGMYPGPELDPDLAGNPRIVNGRVDLGPYERQ
jgi:hypothetical protein